MFLFDTGSFSELFKFYPKRFPTLWNNFNELVTIGEIISVTEVFKELQRFNKETADIWLAQNKSIFIDPTNDEALFIQNRLFTTKSGHFKTLISKETMLLGKPCADPFIIAKAYTNNATVVTQERYKPGAAKIPVACKEFNIAVCNFEEFMEHQNWQF